MKKISSLICTAAIVLSGIAADMPAEMCSLLTASAEESAAPAAVSFDEATGTLTLRGNVERDDIWSYKDNENVKKIVAEKGTVFPNISAYVFDGSCAEEIDLSNVDITKSYTMAYMFSGCRNLRSVNLSGLDTSNIIDMTGMFYACQKLEELNLSGLNTSNVTDMTFMFNNCPKLTSLDINSFDTSKVKTMFAMFENCTGLTSLDLSKWNTSKVRDMQAMFYNCSALKELNINFDTSSAAEMHYMFYGCSSLTKLNVSSFDTSKAENMSNMFRDCKALNELDVSSFDTRNVVNMGNMFRGCSSLTELDLSNFSLDSLADIEERYKNMLDLHDMQFGVGCMFSGCKSLKTIYASDKWVFRTELPRSQYTFDGCISLVGGNGTAYHPEMTGYEYARIDKPDAPGYFTYKAAENQLITGDFDGDGTITANDAQSVLTAYAELCVGNQPAVSAAQNTACDINKDGSLDSGDAQYILLYYVRNTVAADPVTWEALLSHP